MTCTDSMAFPHEIFELCMQLIYIAQRISFLCRVVLLTGNTGYLIICYMAGFGELSDAFLGIGYDLVRIFKVFLVLHIFVC